MNKENKDDEIKVKIIYGKGNLKDIVTDLIEKAFINKIKECEIKWKIINSHLLL